MLEISSTTIIYMLLLMNRLPNDIENDFMTSHFVSKLSPGLFNMVWPDYTLETTENKELKGTGGIINNLKMQP